MRCKKIQVRWAEISSFSSAGSAQVLLSFRALMVGIVFLTGWARVLHLRSSPGPHRRAKISEYNYVNEGVALVQQSDWLGQERKMHRSKGQKGLRERTLLRKSAVLSGGKTWQQRQSTQGDFQLCLQVACISPIIFCLFWLCLITNVFFFTIFLFIKGSFITSLKMVRRYHLPEIDTNNCRVVPS